MYGEYEVKVGDIVSDAHELVRRMNAEEEKVSTKYRRHWFVVPAECLWVWSGGSTSSTKRYTVYS